MHNAADGVANEVGIAHLQALNQPLAADLTEGGTERAWDDCVVVGRERVRGETRLHGCVLQTRAVAGLQRADDFIVIFEAMEL